MKDCKMFVCKYLSTCLYGVECEDGSYPRNVCLNAKCELCMIARGCKLKSVFQKKENTKTETEA